MSNLDIVTSAVVAGLTFVILMTVRERLHGMTKRRVRAPHASAWGAQRSAKHFSSTDALRGRNA